MSNDTLQIKKRPEPCLICAVLTVAILGVAAFFIAWVTYGQ